MNNKNKDMDDVAVEAQNVTMARFKGEQRVDVLDVAVGVAPPAEVPAEEAVKPKVNADQLEVFEIDQLQPLEVDNNEENGNNREENRCWKRFTLFFIHIFRILESLTFMGSLGLPIIVMVFSTTILHRLAHYDSLNYSKSIEPYIPHNGLPPEMILYPNMPLILCSSNCDQPKKKGIRTCKYKACDENGANCKCTENEWYPYEIKNLVKIKCQSQMDSCLQSGENACKANLLYMTSIAGIICASSIIAILAIHTLLPFFLILARCVIDKVGGAGEYWNEGICVRKLRQMAKPCFIISCLIWIIGSIFIGFFLNGLNSHGFFKNYFIWAGQFTPDEEPACGKMAISHTWVLFWLCFSYAMSLGIVAFGNFCIGVDGRFNRNR